MNRKIGAKGNSGLNTGNVTDRNRESGGEQDLSRQTERDQRKECLRRAGILLAQRDYTCSRMREKLLSYGFSDEVVGETLDSLRDARYLDDARYAENYISAHRGDRSLIRIRTDLESRGLSSDLISEVLMREREEHGMGEEVRQILRLMEKRRFDPALATWEEKGKMKAFLYRKGYDASSVRAAMSTALNTDSLDSEEFSV